MRLTNVLWATMNAGLGFANLSMYISLHYCWWNLAVACFSFAAAGWCLAFAVKD